MNERKIQSILTTGLFGLIAIFGIFLFAWLGFIGAMVIILAIIILGIFSQG